MTPPKTALMIVTGDHQPTLQEAAEQLGVAAQDLNQEYGVVPIDPDAGHYSVEVLADRLPSRPADAPYRGPYFNPSIAPFGRPRE